MSTSSNIYISATPGYTAAEGKDEFGYRRQQNMWLIAIEPHKTFIPLLSRQKPEFTYLTASNEDDCNGYTLKEHKPNGIIGTIVIAEGARGVAGDIRKLLEDELHTSVIAETTSDPPSECWIRRAIHILQDHGIVPKYDGEDIMKFANEYIANRINHKAPATITYHVSRRERSDKPKKYGFWISQSQVQRNSYDRESGVYGGLM
ncbi:hypothetical protein M433DRAFT_157673 [Acidomyces richmondensis BFW]|nr:MAG: hypothetical protein FE78DRAFT_84197 [Acidomyces sp. 'richmondensis']KYG42628.1 hypothetical protein M433DRAFT_157673 [Acidomyces richmondensis BFW]